MKTTYQFYIVFFFALFSSLFAFSQTYQLKSFSVDNGIKQPYVYSISQDKNGYLCIGTGEGLCKFDGINFKTFYTTDGISENYITASCKDNLRNLWLGHYQGGITFYDGKKFKSINTQGVSKSPVTSIIEDDKGYIWWSTQNDGIFRISKKFEIDTFKIDLKENAIFSMQLIKNNQLLVGTNKGLMLFNLKNDGRKLEYVTTIKNIPENKIQCIVKKKNSTSYWVGTENAGLFLLIPISNSESLFKVTSIANDIPVDLKNIEDVYEDPQSNLWIATFGNGAIKLILSPTTLKYTDFMRFSEDNGLGTKFTKTIYMDPENNIWVGTYGSGLVELTDDYFTFYSRIDSTIQSNNASCLLIDNNTKWIGTSNGLLKTDLSTKRKSFYYSANNGFVNDKVTAICKLDSITLLVGTENKGVFELNTKTAKFSPLAYSTEESSNKINALAIENNHIWIATQNGLFKLQPKEKIKIKYNGEYGLSDNNNANAVYNAKNNANAAYNVNSIYVDSKNRVWVATQSNYVSIISADRIEKKKINYGTDLLNVTSIVEDKKGSMWLGTFGSGVIQLTNDSIKKFTTDNGLKSNYCYSIICDGSNNIWVGHQLGLSKINNDNHTVEKYGKEDGIKGDCNYNAFVKDNTGCVWLGTTSGIIKYDPFKDKKNSIPPVVNIISVKIGDSTVDFSNNIKLPYGEYKLRIDFIGISFKKNSSITYQYKLEGFDADWSDKSTNTIAPYGNLSSGNYKFLIKAFNSDGVSTELPVSVSISIASPIWKSWWFIVLMIVAVIYGLYLLVKMRERTHRKFQVKLQKALNEKTREVILKNEEIERKNKDITDSIRYAKRIQDAILPDWGKIRKIFPESFVFFQPRDIVSGDFYWFEKYKNHLILACADATGHGVPGALMSVIGNTMLKDITARPDVTSPLQVLTTLDREIKTLLQQSDDENDHTDDNVDIIICEINIETLLVRISSTKRPIFVSINNQLTLIKKETTGIHNYEIRDVQLKKGDTLYMFTDGYPDQFGGEKGKKIKMSNVATMLEQIQSLPIDKQQMIVDRYFNRWKEGHEQVDDVLFIGLKF